MQFLGVKFSFHHLFFHLIAADLLALLASFVTRHVKFFLLVFPSSSARGNNDNRSKLKIVDAFTPRKEKKVSASEGYWFYMSPSFNTLAIFSKDFTIKSTHYCFSEIKSVSENCFNPVTHRWRTWSSVSFELCRRDAPKGVSCSARCTISVHPLMKQL